MAAAAAMATMLQQAPEQADVLYEPMVGDRRRAPAKGIYKNKKKLPDEEIVRYEAQSPRCGAIVEEFGAGGRRRAFQTVITLLQEMEVVRSAARGDRGEGASGEEGRGYELPLWMQPGAAGAEGMPPGTYDS